MYVWAWCAQHKQLQLLAETEQKVNVPVPREHVGVLRWRVESPVEVDADAVEASSLVLLQHLPPSCRVWQPPIVELATEKNQRVAVQGEHVSVPAENVAKALVIVRHRFCRDLQPAKVAHTQMHEQCCQKHSHSHCCCQEEVDHCQSG